MGENTICRSSPTLPPLLPLEPLPPPLEPPAGGLSPSASSPPQAPSNVPATSTTNIHHFRDPIVITSTVLIESFPPRGANLALPRAQEQRGNHTHATRRDESWFACPQIAAGICPTHSAA